MQGEQRERTTFTYAVLPDGKLGAQAYAMMASNTLRQFRSGSNGSAHYDALLEAFLGKLLDTPNAAGDVALRVLETRLSERLNTLLKAERDRDKTRKQKWAPMAPRRAHVDESSDDDSDVDAVEDADARAARERAEQERQEEEWRKSNERYEALQRQREENAAKLRARARQVDATALAEKLRSGGVVLLNAGAAGDAVVAGLTAAAAGGNGGGAKKAAKSQQVIEADKLKRDVAEVVKAKERLRAVLQTSDDELPASIAAAQRELHELQQQQQQEQQQQREGNDEATSTSSSALSKGQMAQLQQKLSKQGLERDRLALQVKALPPNAQRDELLELLQQRDRIAIDLDMAAAAQRSA